MQSLRRQIKRGNAVIAFDSVTKSEYVCAKRGSTEAEWRFANSNRMKFSEEEYLGYVTRPLIQSEIQRQEQQHKKYIFVEPEGQRRTKKTKK